MQMTVRLTAHAHSYTAAVLWQHVICNSLYVVTVQVGPGKGPCKLQHASPSLLLYCLCCLQVTMQCPFLS